MLRQQVANLIGADPKEIVFTSGATESNNMALKGVANFYKERKNHIITTQTDHKCVLDSARHLQQRGFEVGIVLFACPAAAAPVPACCSFLRSMHDLRTGWASLTLFCWMIAAMQHSRHWCRHNA